MFDVERFVADCRDAAEQDGAREAIREIVERSMSDPSSVLNGLGEPRKAGVQTLHHSAGLTILNLAWGPNMMVPPHEHRMWAVIGIYTGREDNIFWRREPEREDGKIRAAGAKALCVRDVAPLGPDIIHSVINPVPRVTGAIHVYGGDFFGVRRSEWDSETLLEGQYDVNKTIRLFEESNSRLAVAG